MVRNIKSNLLTKVKNLNFYGYKKKKVIPSNPLKKHEIVFNSDTYNLSLSDIRKKINSLKDKSREIKEKKLVSLKYKGKDNFSDLRKHSILLRSEISKFEVLENLIIQKELLNRAIQESFQNNATSELSKAVLNEYKRFVRELTKTTNELFKNNPAKKNIYLSTIFKTITEQMILRTDNSRHRLFRHATKEILKKPLEQLDLSLYKN